MPQFKSSKIDANEELFNIISFILKNFNEYIIIVSENFQIIYFTEEIFFMELGYSKKDLIGKDFIQIIHPEDKKFLLNLEMKDLKIREKTLRLHVKHKDGNWSFFDAKFKAFDDINEELMVIIVIEKICENQPIVSHADSKEKNKADHKNKPREVTINKLGNVEEKYQLLIENLPFSIFLLDSEGIIKDTNFTTTKLLGYSKDEIIDSSFSNLSTTLQENFHFFLDHFNNNRDKSELLVLEADFKRKDGELIWINMQSSVVIIDDNLFIQVMLFNISERKRAEGLIREEFDKLKELEKIRRDLISSVSHELKTPLMTILGSSELLLDVFTSSVNDEALDLIKMIERGSRRLADLVERFFDISRLELNTLNLENKECNLSKVIQECSNELKYLLKRREIILSLNLQADLVLEVDKLRFEQVILNLLSNAIKNTPPKGRIDISLRSNDEWAIVSVKDSGVGLTENELKNLKTFTRFTKLERQGPGTEYLNIQGTGLGLFISKKIVDLFKGEINVHSEGRNKGSTFTIKLPIYSK